MASGVCVCGHAQAVHNGSCNQMIPVDNRGNYRQCSCQSFQDRDD